jgi:hypothetical protein
MPSSTLLIYVFIVYLFLSYVLTKSIYVDVPASFAILFLDFLLITFIFYGHPRHVKAIDFIFILMAVQACIGFIVWLYDGGRSKQ